MKTNFEHLKNYPKFYEYGTTVEKQILNAENSTELENAGNTMRKLIEGLVKLMMEKYHFEVDGLEENKHVSFGSHIRTLRLKQAINQKSIDNLYRIKDLGNISSHPTDTISEAEIREMYKLVYEESYRFVNFYLTDKALADYKKGQRENAGYRKYKKQAVSNDNTTSNESSFDGWLAVGIACAVIVFGLLIFL